MPSSTFNLFIFIPIPYANIKLLSCGACIAVIELWRRFTPSTQDSSCQTSPHTEIRMRIDELKPNRYVGTKNSPHIILWRWELLHNWQNSTISCYYLGCAREASLPAFFRVVLQQAVGAEASFHI